MDNYTVLAEKWPDILDHIKTENDLTAVSFSTWIEPLVLKAADHEGVTLYVPMGGMAINLLGKRYTYMIRTAVTEVTGLNLNVHYTEKEDLDYQEPETDDSFSEIMERAHLDSKYTFDSFVVGSNNKFAHAASLAVAESPGEIYNPLYLYAGVGLGKTHLMHSIAHFILKRNPEARVLYVTSETFTNELIDSIRNGNNSAMSNFRKKYRNIDRATDVLSFPLGVDGKYDINNDTGAQMLGDIVISVEHAVRQAELYGHSFNREIAYLTVHSMLHLLGYDHEAGGLELVRMREKEEAVLTQLGLVRSGSYYTTEG